MLISGDTANSTYGKQFWKPKVNLLRITEYSRYSCQGIVALQKQKVTAGSISQEGKKNMSGWIEKDSKMQSLCILTKTTKFFF